MTSRSFRHRARTVPLRQMGILCCSFAKANECTARQNLATHNRVVLVMVCIVETRLTVVLDLMHILAFQTLKFCKSPRQSNNTTLYNTFMCSSKEHLFCWGLAAGYQPRPQVVDRGTTTRYGGQLRYSHPTNKQSRTMQCLTAL